MLVLTTFDLDEYVYAALRAGASGFLLKDAPADQLVAAVRAVVRRRRAARPAITRRLIDGSPAATADAGRAPRPVDSLTAREREVLSCSPGPEQRRDRRPPDSAERTVKTHVARILAKLGLATGSRPSSSPTRPAWYGPATPGRSAGRQDTDRPALMDGLASDRTRKMALRALRSERDRRFNRVR